MRFNVFLSFVGGRFFNQSVPFIFNIVIPYCMVGFCRIQVSNNQTFTFVSKKRNVQRPLFSQINHIACRLPEITV